MVSYKYGLSHNVNVHSVGRLLYLKALLQYVHGHMTNHYQYCRSHVITAVWPLCHHHSLVSQKLCKNKSHGHLYHVAETTTILFCFDSRIACNLYTYNNSTSCSSSVVFVDIIHHQYTTIQSKDNLIETLASRYVTIPLCADIQNQTRVIYTSLPMQSFSLSYNIQSLMII